MDQRHVQEIAEAYLKRFPEDSGVISELLRLMRAGADITSRKEARGHVTCGGIVVRQDGRVLMVHHRILDRWLLPGGHVEQGDASLRDSALREIQEEAGLAPERLMAFANGFDVMPIHVDCHPIPANPAKGEPHHQHFDFRFVFRGDGTLRKQDEEVLGCEWVSIDYAPAPVRDRLRRVARGLRLRAAKPWAG